MRVAREFLLLFAVGMAVPACSKSKPEQPPDPVPVERTEAAPAADETPESDPAVEAAMQAYEKWRSEILTGDGPLEKDWQKQVRGEWQTAQNESDPFLKELGERVAREQFPRHAQVWREQTQRALADKFGLELTEEQLKEFGQKLLEDFAATDESNLVWLRDIYEERGEWFKISEIGERGAGNAWLIIQHAVDDPFLMARVLADMEALYPLGEADGSKYAMLYDRIQMRAGKPQRYGSQLSCKDGRLVPHEIEDEYELDARRKDVGLMPMAKYLKLFGDRWC